MSRNLLWSAAALAALLALALGLFWPDSRDSGDGQAAIGQPRTLPTDAHDPGEAHEAAVQHRPLRISAAPAGGPIVLPVSSREGPLSLEDYRGQYVWIYFGYTACPDACPMTLALISQALSRLPPEWQGRVRGLFVSVDPERDGGSHLRDYVGHFHPDIDAATGPHEQLREIAARYGVFYQRSEIESALGYVVDHSSSTYLVGPDGALLAVHPHGTSPPELIQALPDRPHPP
jgi:protein SCO1